MRYKPSGRLIRRASSFTCVRTGGVLLTRHFGEGAYGYGEWMVDFWGAWN